VLPAFLRPAFPDAGRLLVQTPELDALTRGRPLAGRVLNAGCGEGAYCPWLESFAGITRIDNIDIGVSPQFLAAHRDPRHHVETGSLTALPYADASFDVVVCTEVIEHIPDHERAVSELARVLSPGGMLIASVPQRPSPYDPNHARQDYTLDEFRSLLEGAGFVVEDHRSCCHACLRLVMRYWRTPLVRFGGNRTPYLPQFLLTMLATADRSLRPGKPWDLVVRASRRTSTKQPLLTSPAGLRRTSS
jgi:SAM-dependent methyltransferase